jgi:predicted nucleic acid-binding protein
MAKFVVHASVVLRLAASGAEVGKGHKLLAPTLLRSQVLSALHEAVHRGELTHRDARERLDRVKRMRIRLLGDAHLQQHAMDIADRLGWASTYDAEYLALTELQADAFVTLDAKLARTASKVVPVTPIRELLAHGRRLPQAVNNST